MSGGWPLSAVGTELLRRRPVSSTRAVVLTLKELVVCGAWRTPLRPVGGSRRTGLVQRVLEPGDRPTPDRPPLPLLHARLRPLVGGQVALEHLGPRLAVDRLLGRALVAAAQDDLLARGLLGHRRGLLNRCLLRTPAGEAWHRGLEERLGQWRQALAEGGRPAQLALDELSRAPGLVPLLRPRTLRDVDRAVRARDGDAGPSGGGGDGGPPHDGVRWSDLDGLDGGLDGTFGGLDSGVGDSGGGDGGGGDGGGGGGD